MSLRRTRLPALPVILGSLVAVGACTASPPLHGDAAAGDLGSGHNATRATCSPPFGTAMPACPGTGCPQNAVGAPDGITVDLTACGTLDLFLETGSLISGGTETDDLRVTLGAVGGLTQVEASERGDRYTIIGFIAPASVPLPHGAVEACRAKLTGAAAALSLSRCNTLARATFVRLIRDGTVSGASSVDAIEAISFQPAAP